MAVADLVIKVAAVAAAVGVLLHRKAPLGRLLRWLWRRNAAEPAKAAMATVVRGAVQPMFEESRAATKAQHDEQNLRFDGIEHRLDRLERRDPGGKTS